MRALLVVCAILLAGCTTPPPAPPVAAPAIHHAAPSPVVLVNGTFKWHDHPTTTIGLFDTVVNPVTQVTANPCVFQGRPYFNNKQLPSTLDRQPRPPGLLNITLDWTDADFAGKSLVAAYRAPHTDAYLETGRIARGATLQVAVGKGNATDGDDGWDLWVCLNDEASGLGSPTWQPGPFVGSVHARVVFTPKAK